MAAFHVFRLHENAGRWSQGKLHHSPLFAPIAPIAPALLQSGPPECVSTDAGNPPLSTKKPLRLSPPEPKRRGRKPRSKDIEILPIGKSLFAPLVPKRRILSLPSDHSARSDVPIITTSSITPDHPAIRPAKTTNITTGIKKKRGRPAKPVVPAISTGIKKMRGRPRKSTVPNKPVLPAKSATPERKVVVETFWHRDKNLHRTTEKQPPFERKWISQNEEVAGRVAKMRRGKEGKV